MHVQDYDSEGSEDMDEEMGEEEEDEMDGGEMSEDEGDPMEDSEDSQDEDDYSSEHSSSSSDRADEEEVHNCLISSLMFCQKQQISVACCPCIASGFTPLLRPPRAEYAGIFHVF